MPAGPGENLLTTLFADVHYYFSPPTSKPQHHSFSRGSYVYLFHNPNSGQAKLEVANHAGTPDQTAFSGYLNVASLQYSYKQPCLCTITVDGSQIRGHDQWHLPNYNERNEGPQKYLYKLNTLDVYLWTEKDAATLLSHLQNVLPSDRLDIRDAPAHTQQQRATPAEHRDSMSPVVQQLEKTAIGTPYQSHVRPESTASAQSIPGPPTPATSPPQQQQQTPQQLRQSSIHSFPGSPAPAGGVALSPPPPQSQVAPLAYNPAAPAAPEQRIHREKTPPLEEGGQHTSQQQYANVPNTFASSAQPTPQGAYFTGPPQQQQQQAQQLQQQMSFPGPPQHTHSGSLPPPPPPSSSQPQQQQYNPSFGAPPTHSPQNQNQQPVSPPPTQQSLHSSYSGISSPPVQQFASYPSHTPSFGPGAIASPGMPPPGVYGQQQQGPLTGQMPPTPSAPPGYSSPGMPPPGGMQHGGMQQSLSSPGFAPSGQQHRMSPGFQVGGQQQQQQQQGVQAQPQTFSYSNYNYTAAQQPQSYAQGGGYSGDVHGQAYRPTEQEMQFSGRPQPVRQDSSRTEQRIKAVEGKVGGYLKKLDKLW